jgi:RHS repeat-associated protein
MGCLSLEHIDQKWTPLKVAHRALGAVENEDRNSLVLKDHLGSVRVEFKDDGTGTAVPTNVTNYYPFGLPWDSDTDTRNNWTYTGQELQRSFDLGLQRFDFRFYDPSIARFIEVDPITSSFPHVSTYNYTENSPLANIDLHGLQKISVSIVGQFIINGSSVSAGGTATLDIGNNNSFNFSFAANGIGGVNGSFSQEGGFQTSPQSALNLIELGFDIDKPQGIKVPKSILNFALDGGVFGLVDGARDAFRPANPAEAMSISQDEIKFNESMQFVFDLVDFSVEQDLLTPIYDYDGSSGEATNAEGETYGRRFTHVYRGKVDDFQFGSDGISFRGKLLISFTDQSCTSNCD